MGTAPGLLEWESVLGLGGQPCPELGPSATPGGVRSRGVPVCRLLFAAYPFPAALPRPGRIRCRMSCPCLWRCILDLVSMELLVVAPVFPGQRGYHRLGMEERDRRDKAMNHTEQRHRAAQKEFKPRMARITRIKTTAFLYPCYPCHPWFEFLLCHSVTPCLSQSGGGHLAAEGALDQVVAVADTDVRACRLSGVGVDFQAAVAVRCVPRLGNSGVLETRIDESSLPTYSRRLLTDSARPCGPGGPKYYLLDRHLPREQNRHILQGAASFLRNLG